MHANSQCKRRSKFRIDTTTSTAVKDIRTAWVVPYTFYLRRLKWKRQTKNTMRHSNGRRALIVCHALLFFSEEREVLEETNQYVPPSHVSHKYADAVRGCSNLIAYAIQSWANQERQTNEQMIWKQSRNVELGMPKFKCQTWGVTNSTWYTISGNWHTNRLGLTLYTTIKISMVSESKKIFFESHLKLGFFPGAIYFP